MDMGPGPAAPHGLAQASGSTPLAPSWSLPVDRQNTPSIPKPKSNVPSNNTPGSANIPISARRSEKLDLSSVERKGKPLAGWREPANRSHTGGIKDAPTFRPTEEEWRNPMTYIKSIAVEGEKYGICKIIPPDTWNPDFAVDTERFHFRTRKQELNHVEGGNRANNNYLDQLGKFHKIRGTNLVRFPYVDKRPLDLYELKKAVQGRGGFERVCDRKKWAEIGRVLGYSGKIMSSLSTSLKHSYEKWLLPYEQWLATVKPGVQMQLEQERGGPYGTPSPAASPFSPMKQRSTPHTPSGLSRESQAMRASEALNLSIGHRDAYSQPLEHQFQTSPPRSTGFTPANAGLGFGPISNGTLSRHSYPSQSHTGNGVHSPLEHHRSEEHPAVQTPNSLPHQAGSKPVQGGSYGSWELKRSYSDMDQVDSSFEVESRNKKQKRAPTVSGSHMSQHCRPSAGSTKANPAISKAKINAQGVCEGCGIKPSADSYVSCGGTCDFDFHRSCMESHPSEKDGCEYYCPRCLVGNGDFGFEEGSIYSLRQFQVRANDFKENHFKGKTPYDPVTDSSKPVTEDDVEKEFWRLVANLNDTVEVEYGADIHSTAHGSGFPTIERHPRNLYSIDPWNLNVLPLHGESLFKHIKSDISGMTVPWLYVGMVFSTFCWHNEDHYAYSANYQHFGATKTWYGVPGADAEKFEDAMKKAIPDLFESQPDLLFQLTTLLPPETLRKDGVNVYAVDQRAGQFVITFPQAYHAGFNHGFNFNEAVNFAPADWEPFGRDYISRVRDFRKPPCFSHDELLLTAGTAKDVPIKTAKWLAPALQSVLDRELGLRLEFEQQVVDKEFYQFAGDEHVKLQFFRQTDSQDVPEEHYLCQYCKQYSYLSRFACEQIKKVSCIDHIEMIDWTVPAGIVPEYRVHIRMTTAKLEGVVNKIKENAGRPDAWIEKFHQATDDIARPSLKVMRSLLSEGERIPWPINELYPLKKSVEACNEWVEEAINFISRKQQNRRKSEKAWRKNSTAKSNEAEDKEREFRKISNIRRLLQRADVLSFDCPEINTLQEKLDQIKDYQQDVCQMIENIGTQKTEDIAALIETGKGFSVDMDEIGHLEKILEQMQWVEKAQNPTECSTLPAVDALLQEGMTLGVPPYHRCIQVLRTLKHQGENLAIKIAECLGAETINLSQLEALAYSAQRLPVSEKTLIDMNAILKKQREAQKRVHDMIQACKQDDIGKRPSYKEFCECMDSLQGLTSKPEGMADLDKFQKDHEDWMRRGKKLFGKTNAPLPILHQHLSKIDERNKFCFDTNEQIKPPVEPTSRGNTPEQDAVDGRPSGQRDLFCLCRRPEEGMMLECKICQEWYHSKCLKIARGKIKEDDDFVCPVCDHRVKIPRDAIRPKLEEMAAWQAEIPALPFKPDEEAVLDSIVSTGQTFRDFITPFMNNPMMATHEEVPMLRFYLRKIEGADILLSNETNFFRQELYRFAPYAPEAPPIIEFSASTRKPRPTKQQKLMKEYGVDKPEDLPVEVRLKAYGRKQRGMSQQEKDERLARGERISNTPTLQFRPPLTAGAFPKNKRAHQDNSRVSPLLSNGAGNPYGRQISGMPPGSPLTFGTASAGSPEPNLDPNIFANDMSFESQDADRPQLATETNNVFDVPGDSSQNSNAHFDSMFADLTNQDDSRDDPNMDPALFNAIA